MGFATAGEVSPTPSAAHSAAAHPDGRRHEYGSYDARHAHLPLMEVPERDLALLELVPAACTVLGPLKRHRRISVHHMPVPSHLQYSSSSDGGSSDGGGGGGDGPGRRTRPGRVRFEGAAGEARPIPFDADDGRVRIGDGVEGGASHVL